jgi:CubicO group peptidase (beta-lactamase class C family)
MKIIRCLFLLVALLALARYTFGRPPGYESYIESYAKAKNFSGTVLIQKGGRTVYAKSFGWANRQHKVPNDIDTKYKVASITKAFTAVLILRLYERGRIDLNKTIRTYLPDYAGEAGDKVTIHQLLNHTSGMANIDRNLISAESAVRNGIPHYQTPLTTDELLAKYCSERLVNEPGKAFDYNNADYIVLGKIIERVHGKTFEQVLGEEILHPLGMRDSGMLYQHEVLDGLADTYFFRDDLKRLANDLPVYIENWYAAGAMYSTARDLLKFSDTLFGARLLKAETVALMLRPGLDDYGYGVWVYEVEINHKRRVVVKRPGRIMGAQSMLFRLLNDGVTIIILGNTDAVSLDDFAAEVGKRVVD